MIFLTHCTFRNISVNNQTFRDFLVIFLLLISSLTLYSQNPEDLFPLRFVEIQHLVNVDKCPMTLEKGYVRSVVGCSIGQ